MATEAGEIKEKEMATEAGEIKEKEMATDTPVILVGRQKGHEVKGERIDGDKISIKITSWTLPDGKPAPKGQASQLVGKTFAGLTSAGAEVFKVLHEHYNTPESLKGRWMIFKDEKSSRTPSRPAKPKASKNGATPKKAGRPAAAKPGKKPRARNVIEVTPDQSGVKEGSQKFWCNACMSSFIVRKNKSGALPNACPKGHKQGAVNADIESQQELEELEID